MNMKLIAVVAALAFAGIAQAQSGGMKAMDMKDMDMKPDKNDSKAAAHKATGIVTKVDAAKGRVSIKHDPIQSLKWPAMTMAFTVKDKKLLDKLAVDKKVDFEFVQRGKDYIVTSVK